MVYDNTKLENAITLWLRNNCNVGFGEVYAGDLLADFNSFLAETSALKSSPGRVAFGAALRRQGFEKKKRAGMTYWCGLTLKSEASEPAEPVRYGKTAERAHRQHQERLKRKGAPPGLSESEKEAKLKEFHKELELETEDAVRSVQ